MKKQNRFSDNKNKSKKSDSKILKAPKPVARKIILDSDSDESELSISYAESDKLDRLT